MREDIGQALERLRDDWYNLCNRYAVSQKDNYASDIDFIEDHIKALEEHIELLQEQNKFFVITKNVPF